MNKFILIFIFTLFQFSVSAEEKKDCSKLKKLSKEYLGCLKNNISKTGNKNNIIKGFKEKKPLLEIFKKKD
jgi:hypothetical protein